MRLTFNDVFIMGRAGTDPREISNNCEKESERLARIQVATNQYYRNRDGDLVTEVEWHSIYFRGFNATKLLKFVEKGDVVCAWGRLRSRRWVDEKGTRHNDKEVYAHRLVFLKKDLKSGIRPETGLMTNKDPDLLF